jgi:hypothetical protein
MPVTTKRSESWRLACMDQIRLEQAERVSKMRELRAEMDRLEALETPLVQKLMRAQSFDVDRGICPRCAIDDAKSIKLVAIPTSAIVVEGQQQNVDVMNCPECGWDDTVSC